MNALSPASDDPPIPPGAVGAQELSKVLRHLGVHSMHAAEVDIASHATRHACSVIETGEVSAALPLAMDIAFPGGGLILAPLAQASVEVTRVLKVGPKRCLLAWRLNDTHARIVDVQFRHPRHEVSEAQSELIRFVASASIQSVASAVPAADAAPSWSQFEPQPDRPRYYPAILGLTLLAAAISAWIGVVSAPSIRESVSAQQVQVARLREMAERTLVLQLSAALATADYGQVQEVLTDFSKLGYFAAAVVTNDAHRVVAMSGAVDTQRIGDGVTPEFARTARVLPLKLGSQMQGQLLFTEIESPGVATAQGSGVATSSALAGVAALTAAALLALRRRERPNERLDESAPASSLIDEPPITEPSPDALPPSAPPEASTPSSPTRAG